MRLKNKNRLQTCKPRMILGIVLIAILTISIQPNKNVLDSNDKRLWKSLRLSATVSELWNFTTGDNLFSSPALGDLDGDGMLEVVFGSENKNVYALNGEDGSKLWNFITGFNVFSSPALGDVDGDNKLEVIIGSTDNNVYVLNGKDGSELWNFTTGGEMDSSPALGDVDGDETLEVVIGGIDPCVCAINGEDGDLLWRFGVWSFVFPSPALGDLDGDDTIEIVIGDDSNGVYMLNPEPSGKRIYWNGLSGDTNFSRCKNQQYHDFDFDLLSNYSEKIYHTDPIDSDTDNDLLLDGNEVNNHGTEPTNADTDGDGLSDGDEINIYSTDPLSVINDPLFVLIIIIVTLPIGVFLLIFIVKLYPIRKIGKKKKQARLEAERIKIEEKEFQKGLEITKELLAGMKKTSGKRETQKEYKMKLKDLKRIICPICGAVNDGTQELCNICRAKL